MAISFLVVAQSVALAVFWANGSWWANCLQENKLLWSRAALCYRTIFPNNHPAQSLVRFMSSCSVAVIGGGPAGLMAAETLVAAGVRVDLYDAMPSVGRKFLLAGRGGDRKSTRLNSSP